ncbi:MAG: sulfoxide reductase heme-binding subunit YedZ [Anaerolineae bacterium]|nr:sulfoxide reductase heme-binding subunit YedZ [Anaerolineae bacterium]
MEQSSATNDQPVVRKHKSLNANPPRFTPLQWVAHIAGWAPLVTLAVLLLSNKLTVNPIQAATQRTGDVAIIFLLLSLACTPLITLTGWKALGRVRRPLGLYAFMYAAIHFTLFAVVDYGLNLELLLPQFLEKRFIWVGLPALLILSILAITSIRAIMKRMGKAWKRLHRLVYLAGVLVIFHYGWALKGDFLRLKGNVGLPLLAGGILVIFLLLRIPVVREQIKTWRKQVVSK